MEKQRFKTRWWLRRVGGVRAGATSFPGWLLFFWSPTGRRSSSSSSNMALSPVSESQGIDGSCAVSWD
ncbi:hypothetical protein Cadr_000014080 [Camelus dromedarius]|uniref:Uncharacterized protein n=1 Tax=Camelus dromedarius TaxID=9838 RepID=A0A5N4DC91_CAMDR|nr:hypothetical protein Cadr_000014080 [Camelus dromedarius]